MVSEIAECARRRYLVTFRYRDKTRRVEPYSLRYPRTGNILLYGYDQMSDGLRAFRLDLIEDFTPTTITYEPRWKVEFDDDLSVTG